MLQRSAGIGKRALASALMGIESCMPTETDGCVASAWTHRANQIEQARICACQT